MLKRVCVFAYVLCVRPNAILQLSVHVALHVLSVTRCARALHAWACICNRYGYLYVYVLTPMCGCQYTWLLTCTHRFVRGVYRYFFLTAPPPSTVYYVKIHMHAS